MIFFSKNGPAKILSIGLACACTGYIPLSPAIELTVTPQPVARNHPRIGLNLGHSTNWGAEQLTRNIVKNPGFEGMIDRTLVVVETADWRGFTDNVTWTARPEGFWNGADYEVLTGQFAGRQGQIFRSDTDFASHKPHFTTKNVMPRLQPGDIISLSKTDDHQLPTQWWFGSDQQPFQIQPELNDIRPNSPGQRSLKLQPLPSQPAILNAFWDGITARAGNLLPINGAWRLSFWVKQPAPGNELNVQFRRVNHGQPFVMEQVELNAQWQRMEYLFTAEDTEVPGPLELTFKVTGQKGSVLLDDVSLEPVVDQDDLPFRTEVIETLKTLQPGYLRDWQGQLGDSFANRIASPFARRTSRYRPGKDSSYYFYSLNDFFRLAQTINSTPWLIIPTTLTQKEAFELGQYLKQQVTEFGFNELLLEFGNENWNSVFRPAGIMDFTHHGEAAERIFAQILRGAGRPDNFRTLVNAQYVNPWAVKQTLKATPSVNSVAIAPYFLFELNEKDRLVGWEKLFKQDDFFDEEIHEAQNLNKSLAIYEVNLHSTRGDASVALRNDVTTSLVAGSALAKRLITALNYGIDAQCVYQFSQYDVQIDTGFGKQYTKLWGITRDLTRANRFRPTGQVLALLNQILPGDIHTVTGQSQSLPVTLSAIHNEHQWAIAMVSESDAMQSLTINLPKGVAQGGQYQLITLSAPGLAANNEMEENVVVQTTEKQTVFGDNIQVDLPAFHFAIALIQTP